MIETESITNSLDGLKKSTANGITLDKRFTFGVKVYQEKERERESKGKVAHARCQDSFSTQRAAINYKSRVDNDDVVSTSTNAQREMQKRVRDKE